MRSAALLAAVLSGFHRGLRGVQNLEGSGLDHLLHHRKSVAQQALIRKLAVRDHPEMPVLAQRLGGVGDELHADEQVGVFSLVKRRVHDDRVKLRGFDPGCDVVPMRARFHAGGHEAEIAPGTLETVGVRVVDVEGDDVVAVSQQVVAKKPQPQPRSATLPAIDSGRCLASRAEPSSMRSQLNKPGRDQKRPSKMRRMAAP